MKAKAWTHEEIELLKKHYLNYTVKELREKFFPDRTEGAIKRQKDHYGLKKNKTWTEEEIELLKIHWAHSDMETLLSMFPGRNYNQLMCKAGQLKIKSETRRNRKGSLSFLNTLTPQSAYWWGFIMADGHLSPEGFLQIGISGKDKEYLQVLANHLKCELHYREKIKCGFTTDDSSLAEIRIGDKKFIKEWYNKLSYVNPKTENPPKLDIFYKEELLVYFLIGFIDGDGSIWRSNKTKTNIGSITLRIEIHPTWENTLRELCNKIDKFYGIQFNVKLSSKGFIKAEIASQSDLFELYKYINKCDYLKRKWNRVAEFIADKESK